MNKEQISFGDIREGDKLMLEGGYTTSTPVTALKVERLPEDAGLYAGQWAWYFIESAPLVGQRCFIGETQVYRVLEDECEYAVMRNNLVNPNKSYIVGNFWSDKADRESLLESLSKVPPNNIDYKLVKRRKAGEIEDVEV